MKIYNKFVESKKEPSNKNDIWFDGEVFDIYKEGKWQAFTFRISDAEAVIRITREFVDYYNNDIKPTVQEAQEAAARIETYVNLAIEAAETSTRNNELFVKLNAQLAEVFSELQSLIDASNTAISSAQEAASLASSQAKLTQQATQETIEATENANNAINTINILVETLEETINNKVDKIPGKGLSTNDFTNEDKGKLAELSNKVNDLLQGDEFDKEGNYPSLHVGTADDLAGRGESVPASFGFRASGGKSIKDGRAYIKRIKGNSVVWNQMFTHQYATTISSGVKISKNADNSLTCVGTLTDMYFNFGQFQSNIENHKYLFILDASAALDGCSFGLLNRGEQMKISGGFAYIFHTNSDISKGKYIGIKELSVGNEINENLFVLQIDLTKAFPNDWQNINTIEDFNARVATLGVDLNAYNEGQVIHCNTESIKSVGDNAWDEEWGMGRLNTDTGQVNAGAGNNGIYSKNYIKVLPNETYYCGYNAAPIFAMFYDAEYNLIRQVSGSNNFINIRNRQFTTPANAVYMRFYATEITTYKNDICIRLAHTGYKTDYEPYWQDILPLPIIHKYFPDGMKSAGTAHDEIRYNKATQKWEKVARIGEVDMGTLNWAKSGIYTNGYYALPLSGAKSPQYPICRLYSAVSVSSQQDKSIYVSNNGGQAQLFVIDSAYTDVASFKAAMAGVMLYYELAEPIVTELDAEDQHFRDYYKVADFGTEEAIPATDAEGNIIPSANFSADIIYQFNAVDMIREHEIEITELQNVIATMQAQLASLINN